MDTRLASLITLAALAAACDVDPHDDALVAGPDEVVGDDGSAIVGGEVEVGRPAVVAIVRREAPEQLVCSGVLITPTVVVTAAHCLHPHVTGVAADELAVVFGRSLQEANQRIDVVAGAYHPSWRVDDPDAANDIGALQLALPAPVEPIGLGATPPPGQEVVLVGFGDTQRSAATSGIKRSGDAVVTEIGGSWFRMDREDENATTCSGDSGGATLLRVDGVEVLVGVHSRGDCERSVWNERLDVHAEQFLKAFLGEFGACGGDGACALNCPQPDPDCPCAADEVCNPACGAEDPDCGYEPPCDDEDDGTCGCTDEDCQTASQHAPSLGGGEASGCAVGGAAGAPGALLPLVAAAALLAARRRRAA